MAKPGRPPAYQFELSGGALCLDFVNTLGDRPRGREEHLQGPADLVAWAEQARVATAREAAALRRFIHRDPDAATAAFAQALTLRESLYRLFSSGVTGAPMPSRDLAALNGELARSLGHLRLEAQSGAYGWSWERGDPTLDRLLWPVVRSAAELLTSDERADVRECGSETCSWLFVDRSRTRKRRWCSMKTCGNRDKVRRFYERRRRARQA